MTIKSIFPHSKPRGRALCARFYSKLKNYTLFVFGANLPLQANLFLKSDRPNRQANAKQKHKTRQNETLPLGRTKRDMRSISISH